MYNLNHQNFNMIYLGLYFHVCIKYFAFDLLFHKMRLCKKLAFHVNNCVLLMTFKDNTKGED